MGSKSRRHAYFRVPTCVGDTVQLRVRGTSGSRPRAIKQSVNKTPLLRLARRGHFNFPAHLQHSILMLSVSSREGCHPNLSSPHLSPLFVFGGRVTGEGFVSRKGTLLLTDAALKRAAPS